MIKADYNPDVLTCLANLSNDEVFTPPTVVNQMLDLLPQEIWSDSSITFLDPFTKTGVFLREIAKRLIKGLENEFPDQQDRINHIFKNQIFGIAITELTSLVARRSVYCTKDATSEYSIVDGFENEQGNIIFNKVEHVWEGDKCKFCGASKKVYDRDDELETHAYEFIHTTQPEKIFNMRFDVIIGNPPYQLSDGGSGTGISAKPLYHHFVTQAIKLQPRYLSMIIPSRWFAGGRGLDDFREEMLNDNRIKTIVDFMSSKDCFPGVNIAGGVCYFLWDKSFKGDCKVVNTNGIDFLEKYRKLNEFEVFIRSNIAIDIINKVNQSMYFRTMYDFVYNRNPFDFVSSIRGEKAIKSNSVKILSSEGIGFIERKNVNKNFDLIDKYKVIIGKVVPSNGEVDVKEEDGYKVTTKPQILEPNTIHTETYLLLSVFENYEEAENFQDFMMLKFPRFLLKQTLTSMNISRKNFKMLPYLDFTKKWTDNELYDLFNLNFEEQAYIDRIIRSFE